MMHPFCVSVINPVMRPSIRPLSRFLQRQASHVRSHAVKQVRTISQQAGPVNSNLTNADPKPIPTLNRSAYLQQARQKFASLQPTIIPDVLSPTHSHLLTLSLADHAPSLFPSDQLSKSLPSTHSSPPGDLILPQGHHLVYFPLQLPPSQLMDDGTDPAHCPSEPFVRRMWAGGEVVFHGGWQERMRMDGRRAVCVERVVPDSQMGGVGRGEGMERVFVDVQRLYGVVEGKGAGDEEVGRGLLDGKGVAVEEVRRLVFMREVKGAEKGSVGRKIVRASAAPEFTFPLTPDYDLLFHFSALTYNAHAIHLRPDYARYQEGYKQLLVQGPLTLVLMLSALRAALVRLQSQAETQTNAAEEGGWMPSVKSIKYRNLAPLYNLEEMKVCLRRTKPEGDELGWDVWIEGPEGGIAVKGHAATTGIVPPS